MVEELFAKFPGRREDWPKQNMLGRLSKPQEYRYILFPPNIDFKCHLLPSTNQTQQ